MMRKFYSIFLVLVLIQVACGQTKTENTDPKSEVKTEALNVDYPNLKAQAEEFGEVVVKDDFDKVYDYSYPNSFKKLGNSREEIINNLKQGATDNRNEGLNIEKIKIIEIKQIEKIEDELFALILGDIKFKLQDKILTREISMVSVSSDGGTNWKFIYGVNQEKFKELFPNAARKIQIPADKPPKPIEN